MTPGAGIAKSRNPLNGRVHMTCRVSFRFQVFPECNDVLADGPLAMFLKGVGQTGVPSHHLAFEFGEHFLRGGFVGTERYTLTNAVLIEILSVPFLGPSPDTFVGLGIGCPVGAFEDIGHLDIPQGRSQYVEELRVDKVLPERPQHHAVRRGQPALIQAVSSSPRQRLERPIVTARGSLPLASSRHSVRTETTRMVATSVAVSRGGRGASSVSSCDR
ncbi:MAG: hypothetical protein AABP62_05215 [Planctomycetota bacterium]